MEKCIWDYNKNPLELIDLHEAQSRLNNVSELYWNLEILKGIDGYVLKDDRIGIYPRNREEVLIIDPGHGVSVYKELTTDSPWYLGNENNLKSKK